MLGILLERISGIFDRRFLLIYFSPLFLGLSLGLAILGSLVGLSTSFAWWQMLDGVEQTLVSGAFLITNFFLAFLLETLSGPLVRFYEGDWPDRFPLTIVGRFWQRRALSVIMKRLTSTRQEGEETDPKQQRVFARLFHLRSRSFPRDPALLKPTRLGNVLAAAEEYPYQLYQLDAVLWWPRLVPLLTPSFRTQIDTALTPLLTLLNLSSMFAVCAMGGGFAFLLNSRLEWGAGVLIGGLLLASFCYQAAVNQASDYGDMIRVAFDLHRHEILKQMRIAIPDNLVDERLLWDALNNWLYFYIPPWQGETAGSTASLAYPFYYGQDDISPVRTGRPRVSQVKKKQVVPPDTGDGHHKESER